MMQDGCVAVVALALLLSLAGCFKPNDQPELGEVRGTITLDGKPLSGVVVLFQPDNGRPARDVTDAEGNYELKYIRDTMGTKIGHNRVEIAPNEEGDDEEPIESTSEDGEPISLQPLTSDKPMIPARYNTKSELEADVKPGENTFNFDLESDGKT
jgi:hypothetical protein